MRRQQIRGLVFALILCLTFSGLAQAQSGPGGSLNWRPSDRLPRPTRSAPRSSTNRLVSQEVQLAPGETIVSGPEMDGMVIEEGYVQGQLSSGIESSCSDGSCGGGDQCGSCNSPSRLCICLPQHGWVHLEYLAWWQDGMNIPPLVTTSNGLDRRQAGVIGGTDGTRVLYGNDQILDDVRAGGRLRFGWWLGGGSTLGVEGEYFGLGGTEEVYSNTSSGSPVLARPFYNTLTDTNDSQLVAFPGVLTGNVRVEADSTLRGAAVRFRRSLCCDSGCYPSWVGCTSVPTSSRLDVTLGYRYLQLDESLGIRETLTGISPQGSFIIDDQFDTKNLFNGVELGVLWQARRGYWSLDALMRLSLGVSRQRVAIDGSSVITDPTANPVTSTYPGGLLTQRNTNIGIFTQEEFGVVPELGATLGYQLTSRTRLTLGYSFIYWSNVLRPGDQIDLDVNPNLLAPAPDSITGARRPQFQFEEADYWVQGISFGAEYRW